LPRFRRTKSGYGGQPGGKDLFEVSDMGNRGHSAGKGKGNFRRSARGQPVWGAVGKRGVAGEFKRSSYGRAVKKKGEESVLVGGKGQE